MAYDKPYERGMKQGIAVGQHVKPDSICSVPENIYAVSYVLEKFTSSISVRYFPVRAEMWDCPLNLEVFNQEDALYNIRRVRPGHQEFELRGPHQNPMHIS